MIINLQDIKKPHIYIFFNKKEILYVGKSTNLFLRIAVHGYWVELKEATHVKTIPCRRNELDIKEKKYIYRMKPKLNRILYDKKLNEVRNW